MSKSITPKLGIRGMKHLDAVILSALATDATVLLIGPHGSAKTLLAQRVAGALGSSFRHYNTSLLNYDDLVGYPIPDQENKKLDFIQTPGTIWNAEFILFDEISRARPEIQNKVFPIVHEHRVQGIELVPFRGIDVGGESEPFRVSSTLPPNSITRDTITYFRWCPKESIFDKRQVKLHFHIQPSGYPGGRFESSLE